MLKAKSITIGLVVIAFIVAVYLSVATSTALNLNTALGLFLFLVIGVISETHPLVLPGSQTRVTILGVSSYASLALFQPLYAALVTAGAMLIVQWLIEKKPAVKIAFNTSQIFITVALGALTYRSVANSELGSFLPYHLVPLALGISVYFLVNTSLVSFLLSRLNSMSFWRVWSANFRWEVVYVLATIPVVFLLVLAYKALWIVGPLLFIGPLFLLKESYAQYVRLKNTYTETVRTLVKVIETHDTYTAGHSLRVAEYAKRLAIARKLSVKEVEKIEIAAYLHDLGKVDLAITHLVRKPGRLTGEEKRRVQLHPLVSADLAAQVTYFRGEVERIIRHHHEHYDGTGYPHGLRGEEIPTGARIILIADAFDAMTSNRMYRSALNLDRVKEEFRRNAGIQFDPDLVRVFFTHCVRDESMIIPQVEIAFEDLVPRERDSARVAFDAGVMERR